MYLQYRIIIVFLTCLISSIALLAQPWIEWTDLANPTFDQIQETFYRKADSLGLQKNDAVYKKFKRWEHRWENRLMPDRTLPPSGYGLKNIARRKNPAEIKNTSNWSNIGPDSSAGGYMGNGRLNTIAFDPSNTDRYLVGAPIGGIWETTDGAQTWTPLTDKLSILQPIGITDIEFAPNNGNIVYAATGDGYGSNSYSLGIIKSTDGGQTWNETDLDWSTTNFRVIREIIVHPTNSDIVFAATNIGLYYTTDGGSSWAQTLGGTVWDVVFSTNNPDVMFASTDEEIHKSTNGGQSWTQLTNGLPTANSINRIELAVTDANSNYVYALIANFRNLYGVYRTTDGGASWSLRHSNTNLLGYYSDGSDTGGQAYYDLAIAVDPSDEDIIYVGGVNIQRSTDGGSSWTAVGVWTGSGLYNKNSSPVVHADQHSMHFKPGTSILFATNDGGLYSTSNGGSNWTWLGEGLSITQFYDIDVRAINPDRIIGGTQDNGTKLKLEDGNWYNPIGGDGFVSHIDPFNDDNMFGELYYGEILGSANGGSNFFRLSHEWDNQQNEFVNKTGETGAWETPYILNPLKSSTILVGYHNLWRSHNYLQETDYENLTNLSHTRTIRTVGMSPVDTNRIIYSYRNNNTNVIQKTTDGGQNWSAISSPSNQTLNLVVFHATDSDKIWLLYGGYSNNQKVYYSDDFGQTFSNLSSGLPNLPVNTGAFQEGANNRLWIGNDIMVYYTDDETSGWTEYDNGLPFSNIETIVLDQTNKNIYAGTYGRGIWISELPIDLQRPDLISPPNSSEYVSLDTILTWSKVQDATGYDWEFATDDLFANIIHSGSTTDTTWSIPTLDYFTRYYWRVRSTRDAIFSEWTDTWEFITTIHKPVLELPEDASVAIDPDTLLTWEDVPGATGYIVEIDNDSDFSSLVHSSNTVTDNQISTSGIPIEFSTTYYWRVKAQHTKGETEYSLPFTFKTRLAGITLLSPIDSVANISRPADLLWTDNSLAETYEIEISDTIDFSKNTIVIPNVVDSSLSQAGLLSSSFYYWRVRSVDTESKSRWSNTGAFRTIISPPVLVSPTDQVEGLDPNGTILNWDSEDTSVLDSLEIYSDPLLTKVVTKLGLNDTTYSITGLGGGQDYYWRVLSRDDYGSSEWSDTFMFTTRIQGFSQTYPLDKSTTQSISDTLRWASVDGAESYNVQLSTDSSFNSFIWDSTGITDIFLPYEGLEKGITHYWRVQAVSGNITSDWTDTWSFTTISPALSLLSPSNGLADVPLNTSLEWEEIQSAEYELLLSLNNDLSDPLVNETSNINLFQPAFTNSTEYFWAVRYTIDGNSSEWSDIWSFTTVGMLSTPNITYPLNNDNTLDIQLTVEWTSVTGADSYDLIITDQPDNSTVMAITDITETSFDVSDLMYNSDYGVKVRAVSNGIPGEWDEVLFGTGLETVVQLKPGNSERYELPFGAFMFNSVQYAESYQLDISNDAAGQDIILTKTLTDTTLSPIELESTGKGFYYWKVTATSAKGRISESEIWQFELIPTTSVKSLIEIEYGLKVYPNPSDGQFMLSASKTIPYEISLEIYDMQGNHVKSYTVPRNKSLTNGIMIDISQNANGSYGIWVEAGPYSGYLTIAIDK